ncbi:MAG TPA: SUMF1/EgtB/PvdO family nonheme iron enzyme, partial [Bryobacteraceae bacterium]|nr:SUMF1/EgtB/PvdO family nonheme iron enzyme [Bryobacteraceae bacterium]
MRSPVLLLLAATILPAADFRKDVQPVLEQNCTACHGAIKQLGSVRLDTPSGFERAKPAAVLASMESGSMPPGDKLPADVLAPIRDWVRSGAPWPGGTVLATGGAGAGGADNLALVKNIHARIVANPVPVTMAPYKMTIPNTDVSYQMVPVPAGEFRMGTPDSEPARKKDEGPVHRVRVEAFWM